VDDQTSIPAERPNPVTESPPERPFQFTLTQLLLVVLVLSILLAVCVPLIRHANRQAEQMQCANNLKQIGVALHTYHDTWKCLPPVFTTDASGKPMHSWRVAIWPQLESGPYFDQYDFSEPWDGPNNRKLAAVGVPCWRCPSDRRTKPVMTNYVAIYGPGTAWDVNKVTRFADITDGTSNTVLVVEIRNSDIHWMEPRDIHVKDLKLTFNAQNGPSLGSYHIEGAMIVKADGSVHMLSPVAIAERLEDMLTIAGGERHDGPLRFPAGQEQRP
jgi:type II secretory pathway pseudopilin PulG